MTARFVIIGANGGIGSALAKQLEKKGHPLFLTARDESKIGEYDYDNAKTAELDVLDDDAVKNVIENADEGDGIAGIAYCVGSIVLKPFKAAKEDEFKESYDLNVLGAIRVLSAARQSLEKAEGSVVLFSTVAVNQGFSNHTVISTAKGAVEALSKSLAAEWAPKVRVNCIAPSLTNTGIAQSLLSSEQMKKGIASMHPIPRIGEPEDCASMAKFLLTDESSWITGQILHVDGGRSTLRTKG